MHIGSRRYHIFCQISRKDPALGNGLGSHKAYFLFNLASEVHVSSISHARRDIHEASYMACFLGITYH